MRYIIVLIFLCSCQSHVDHRYEEMCEEYIDNEGTYIACPEELENEVPETEENTQVITLCPDLIGRYKEVIFIIDDITYTIKSRGNKYILTAILPGEYITVDGRDCKFTITEDYEVIHE